VPQPPPFTATAAAASPAAASGIAAAAAAATPHAAATRGAPSRAECSVDLKLGGLGRVRGGGRRDEGACGGCNCNGCAIRAVREPDEAPALWSRWRRRGAVPVVRGGWLQGRPQQVPRLPPPPQGLRGALQDARRRRRRPRDALLPAVQQVYTYSTTIPAQSNPIPSHPFSIRFISVG
jgi:hypothetical protein